MTYSMRLVLLMPALWTAKVPNQQGSDCGTSQPALQDYLQNAWQQLDDLVAAFRANPSTPEATLRFEQKLQLHLREIGRLTLQHTLNSLEPDDVTALPRHVLFEGTSYTRSHRKTPQHVWSLFGQLRLRRVGYRSTSKGAAPGLFPLAASLGLLHGATPALASAAGRFHASAGTTQSQTRHYLRAEFGVGWGVKKLRGFLKELAERLTPQRQACLVQRLLAWLQQAHDAKGQHPPVLSVGRDGICLGLRATKNAGTQKNRGTQKNDAQKKAGTQKGVFEVATTATVSVYDRRGQRLGTVYLAQGPQPEQVRMSKELTRLVRGVLSAWPGALPRLCYVTDAGQSETSYYRKVLTVMRHPLTRQRLKWVRVLDYYHASQRVWTMAESLLGSGRAASAWARKMLKWLLLPGGINRVLHSAAALRVRRPLGGKGQERYQKAYRYLSKRLKYLRYAEYRGQGLPISSGVTEAGCKTIYTQRLKLSGMRWKAPESSADGVGAQTVLDLRVLLLSGVWDQAFLLALQTAKAVEIPANQPSSPETTALSA